MPPEQILPPSLTANDEWHIILIIFHINYSSSFFTAQKSYVIV